jgi:lipoprotein LprG
MSLPRRLAAGLSTALLVVSVSACSGDDGGVTSNTEADADDSGDASPEEVMAFAKEKLDATSGVEISLSTDDDPDRDAFLKSADGTIIADPPAFEGTADGRYMGFDASDIAIVSVDGKFYVDLPIRGFDELDPADLCAPDPAQLLDPDSGVSTVLTAAEGLEAGDSERGGPDNSEVLTVFTGTVPNAAIKNVLPCAPGKTFEAKFTINEDGLLREAEVTGQFFKGDTQEITYTIDVEEYDVEKDISAPQ